MTQIVKMKGMNKYFGKLHVLKDIDLTVEQGEVVVIIGASGSGKSTLIRCVNGLEEFESGTLEVDGQKLAPKGGNQQALAEIRKEVGMVFQQFNLLPRTTALDNVALPLLYRGLPHKARTERAAECLRMVGLGDRMDHHPSQLSGGQQQRVAIARALAGKPSILLADEPTGALDSQTTIEVLDILDQLNAEGITIILVTHEDEVGARARRRIWFRDGLIVEDSQ